MCFISGGSQIKNEETSTEIQPANPRRSMCGFSCFVALTSAIVFSAVNSDSKSSASGSVEKLSRCPEDGAGGWASGQSNKAPKSREEMRELVNTPLPSTWRRSSLPTEEPAVMEELWLQAAADAPVHRVVLPAVKSRRESRRSSLNVGPLTSNSSLIDVRKNPI